MKFSKWTIPCSSPEIPRDLLDAGYTPLLAAMLAERGFTQVEAAREFISGGAEQLFSPFEMAGMEGAAARVREAIERGETVAVYGDYDVDGITSCLLYTSHFQSQRLWK